MGDETKLLLRLVYEIAPKSLFWALHLCTQIWARAMTALFKKSTSICQSGWKKIWNGSDTSESKL